MSSLRVAVLTLTVAAGLIAAGCGGSASSLSPTGPSLSGGIAGATLASDAGTFGTEKKGEDKKGGRLEERGVQVNGRITAIDAAAHTFNVGTTKVSVPADVTIRHGNRTFLFTDLAAGDHVQVKGSRDAAGLLVASEVKVEQGRGNDDDEDDDADGGEPQPDDSIAGAHVSLEH